MALFPSSRLAKIEFYESHLAAWTVNPANLGLLPAAVTSLAAATAAARTAFNAHLAAQEAARAATQNFYNKVRAMHSGPGAGADMVETIRNFAASKNDPSVYVQALIPPPATPSPVPPPGTPFAFGVQLLASGALTLTWKCANPAGSMGTLYEVRRRIGDSAGGGGGANTFIGASGTKRFTDEMLSAVAAGLGILYEVTAVRSTSRGNPATFLVRFGTNSTGQVSVSAGGPLTIAA